MRRDRLFPGWLALLLLLSLICGGCGKKGDPMPPKVVLPVVVDLATRSLPEGIVLGWSVAGSGEGISGFRIFRSVTIEGSVACPGCPREYHPFGTVALADDRLKREGGKGFRYVDADVRSGGFYSYRIALCNPAGICGEASNESGLIHTGR